MQTANVIVKNNHNETSVLCCLLLDTGSQRSFISDKTARAVSAEKLRKETFSIDGFGGTSTRRDRDLVELKLCKRNGGEIIDVEAVVVPKICKPVQEQRIDLVKDHKVFANLELADQYEEENEVEIDVLIGLDNYWKIVIGRVIRSDNNIVAVESKLGFILSGAFTLDGNITSSAKCFVVTAPPVSKMITNLKIDMEQVVSKFWNLENLGITEKERGDHMLF